MSLITLPTVFVPSSCRFKFQVNDRVNASPFGGSEQAVDLLNDRWVVTLSQDVIEFLDAGEIEAYIAAMRGRVNTTQLHHYARPAPRGTARGTILINGAVAQGAGSIAIDGISPGTGTLLPGDMLGAGSQLFMVQTAVTAVAGAATVAIVNRTRLAIADNTSVTWDKPKVECRILDATGIEYSGATVEPFSFTFGEKI